MKLNIILISVLIALLGVTFLMFVDEKPLNPREQFLFSPIDNTGWSFHIDQGVLSRKSGEFFWNDKLIPHNNEDLPQVINKIGDFRVIRMVDEITWTQEMKQAEFGINKKYYEISKLNDLTGRFHLFDKQLRKVYLIEDQAPLRELHKSFEVGQKIKYYNLIQLIKNQSWEL